MPSVSYTIEVMKKNAAVTVRRFAFGCRLFLDKVLMEYSCCAREVGTISRRSFVKYKIRPFCQIPHLPGMFT